MAVYKRTYKTYSGQRTASWSRFLVLTRYSYARLFQSKFLMLFLTGCFFYPLGCLVFIYLAHNEQLRALMSLGNADFPPIDGKFFYIFCRVQGSMAFLLTALTGPGLISPDLANGALPLYFSRPISRMEYVAGKMTLLLLLLSLITWIPGLILYAIQASLAGWDWTTANLWLGGGIFLALFIWIFLLSLIGLALSAWVKWKMAAGALVLAIIVAGAGFGNAVNTVLHTHLGGLLSLTRVTNVIWGDLLRYDWGADLSSGQSWTVIFLALGICIWMLARRIRPLEVIK